MWMPKTPVKQMGKRRIALSKKQAILTAYTTGLFTRLVLSQQSSE
ncbi:hypothetical protein [Psychrobacter sp. C 20.9]|nr:hypothetical protein [Psychrobacter sp. C 20.9]